MLQYDLIGNCYVTDTDGGCLCIDLCRRFSARESENVGTDTRGEMYGELKPGTGCEACVRNKNVLWGPAQRRWSRPSKSRLVGNGNVYGIIDHPAAPTRIGFMKATFSRSRT